MIADWVASSVRARGMAQRRVGRGGCDRIIASHDLEEAVAFLAGSVYGVRLAEATTLSEAQRAVSETVLWQLRVLAGWMPANGTHLLAAAAAGFEAENIVALAQQINGRADARKPFELGGLATAWPTVCTATSLADLSTALRESRWGDVGTLSDADGLSDILMAAWLQRLMTAAPAARPWAVTALVLVAARVRFVDQVEPALRFGQIVRPSIADSWRSANSLAGFAAALPRSARMAVDGIRAPTDLWRAEMRLATTVEDDGARLLRGSMPGPEIILGAIALLAVDGWRVRAALASAAASANGSLDVVA